MGDLAFNIAELSAQNGALPKPIQEATAEILRAAEAAGHHIPAVSWFNPASTPEHHVPGFKGQGGVAVDFMTYGNYPLQDWIDTYVWENRARLGVCWLISRRRIRSTSPGHSGNWTHYSGPSPHTDHSHINFGHLAEESGYGHVSKVAYVPPGPPPPPHDGYPTPKDRVVYLDKVHIGQKDSDSVYWVQKALGVKTTGTYDDSTVEAAKAFQKSEGDDVIDGDLGPYDTAALFGRHKNLKIRIEKHS